MSDCATSINGMMTACPQMMGLQGHPSSELLASMCGPGGYKASMDAMEEVCSNDADYASIVSQMTVICTPCFQATLSIPSVCKMESAHGSQSPMAMYDSFCEGPCGTAMAVVTTNCKDMLYAAAGGGRRLGNTGGSIQEVRWSAMKQVHQGLRRLGSHTTQAVQDPWGGM
jgi:hypothetical protein